MSDSSSSKIIGIEGLIKATKSDESVSADSSYSPVKIHKGGHSDAKNRYHNKKAYDTAKKNAEKNKKKPAPPNKKPKPPPGKKPPEKGKP